MTTICQAPVRGDGTDEFQFSDRCVCCNAPATTHSTLLVNRLVMRRQKQIPLMVRMDVPHCGRCARADDWLFRAGIVAALLGFLIVGGLVFVGVFWGTLRIGLDDYGRPQDQPSLVIGAFAGLLAGLVGALLFEAAVRLIIWPLVGRAAFQAPLLIKQFLTDSNYVAGLTGALSPDGARLHLTFEDEMAATDFTRLNRL